jgi:hypothetical protein
VRAALSAIVLVLAGLGLFAWSGYDLIASSTGTQATATVASCSTSYDSRGRTHVECVGSWPGGSGVVDGVGRDDIGHTVAVRVHGDKAYVFTWAALVPAGVGFVLLVGAAFWLNAAVQGRASPWTRGSTAPRGRPPGPYPGPYPGQLPPPPGYGPPPPPPAYGQPPPGYGQRSGHPYPPRR